MKNASRIILGALFVLFSFVAHAQDFMYFSNGEVLRVKVTEVGTSEIRYKKFDNLSGPVYVVNKSEVQKIQYQSGQTDVLSPNSEEGRVNVVQPENPKAIYEEAQSHSLSVNLLDLFAMTDLTIQYEWVNKSAKLGIRIPLTIGFLNRNFGYLSQGDIFGYNTVLGLGSDLRIYPGRVKKVRYVFGPSFNFAYIYRGGFYDINGQKTVYESNYLMRFYFFNGFVVEPTKHFRFGFDGGYGFITNFKINGNLMPDELNRAAIKLNLHLGYKF